jgi:hypothetical protein
MQIKTTLRFYFTPVSMASNKNAKNKCWWGCGGETNTSTLWVEM